MEQIILDNNRRWSLVFTSIAIMCISSIATFDAVTSGSFNAGTRNIINVILYVALVLVFLTFYSKKENRENFKKNTLSSKAFIFWMIGFIIAVLFISLR